MTQLSYCYRALNQLLTLYVKALGRRDFEGMRLLSNRMDALRAVIRAVECVPV